MLGQAAEELGQVVAAPDEPVHEVEQPGAVLRLRLVGRLEEEVHVHHAEGVAEGVGAEGGADERDGLVEEGEGVAEGAVALACDEHERLSLGLDRLLGADLLQPSYDLRHGDAPEVEPLRPREDRREDLVRLGGGEDEEDVRRRLLQRLQERVEGALREHVDLVEDVDLLLRALGRDADGVAQLADVVHLVVRGGVNLDDVHRAALLEGAAGVARAARLGVVSLGQRRGAVDGLGEDARGRRLAHAARPAEEVGVGEAAEADGVAERLRHVLLADHLTEGLRAVLPRGDLVARGAVVGAVVGCGGVQGGVQGGVEGARGVSHAAGRGIRRKNHERGPGQSTDRGPRPQGARAASAGPSPLTPRRRRPACSPACRRCVGRPRRRSRGCTRRGRGGPRGRPARSAGRSRPSRR